MDKNLKSGADEYRRKLKAGEVEKPIVLNPIEKAKANPKSLRAAINAKCWECSCYSRTEVARCTIVKCPLNALRPWQGRD